MKISKEVKVGFFSLLAIALLIWGYNFLKGTNILYKSKTVYTVYPSVVGLAKSSPVLINGFQIGVVESIYFHPKNSGDIVVEMVFSETDFVIPNNSIASLISMDFLGSKAITIKLGNSSTNLSTGDTLIADLEKSMLDDVSDQILPLKDKAEKLMVSLDKTLAQLDIVLKDVDDVLSTKNKQRFSEALLNLNTTIVAYKDVAESMNHSMKTLQPTLKNFKTFSDSLAHLEMNATLQKAQSTFDNMSAIMAKINQGEGSMGKLINNDSLYLNLEAATKDLDKLLIDMKENPKRYVHFSIFGRKD
ncbi:MAG: MCE family protein [Flavobacteriales bacterium]|nr:MCE family protein [Flavobacteriales bacterium]